MDSRRFGLPARVVNTRISDSKRSHFGALTGFFVCQSAHSGFFFFRWGGSGITGRFFCFICLMIERHLKKQWATLHFASLSVFVARWRTHIFMSNLRPVWLASRRGRGRLQRFDSKRESSWISTNIVHGWRAIARRCELGNVCEHDELGFHTPGNTPVVAALSTWFEGCWTISYYVPPQPLCFITSLWPLLR